MGNKQQMETAERLFL